MIANLCAEQGHRVFIHTFDNAGGRPTYPLHTGIEVRTHRERPTPVNEMQILLELTTQCPDLVIGLHLDRGFYQYVYYAHRLGVPLLLSEHDNPVYTHKMGRFFKEERDVIFFGADRIHLLADTFLETLSPSLWDRVRIIPNTATEPELPARLESGSGPKTVLYVGRLVPVKRVANLLVAISAAVKEAPDWRLQIAGDGREEQPLRTLAGKLGLSRDEILFMGRIEDTYALYRAASILVLPSEWEAQSLVVIEAMAHGLPVVACKDCQGMDALVRDGVTGLLTDPGPGLARALTRLMRDPVLLAEMGKAGRERYEKEFAPEAFGKRWLALIEETAAISEPVARQANILHQWPEAALEQAFAQGAGANVAKVIQMSRGKK